MQVKELRVLIVDDDTDDALWLFEIIKESHPQSQLAFEKDGFAALRYLKDNTAPDIVFLDLNMPLKGGLECLRDIHMYNLIPGTPVVIYSTSNNIKDIDLSFKYGAIFFIVKPTGKSNLKAMIDRVFEYVIHPEKIVRDKNNFVLMEKLSINPI